MKAYEIPLSPEPQKFSIQLADRTYQMRFYWCKYHGSWMFDLGDSLNAPILQGIPVVTGTDLLGQYAHLELGGAIIAQTDYDPDVVPTYENLGQLGRVFFLTQ